MKHIKLFESFNDTPSENLKFHLENKMSILDNIFRPESEAFFELIKEAKRFTNLLNDEDKEIFENTNLGEFANFEGKLVPLDLPLLNEADYHDKEVQLNHPTRSSGPKKYKVYVKNPKTGKVKVVNFGDVKGGLSVKVSDPEARKSFAARHQCSTKKDKTKPGYWACRMTKFAHLLGGKTYPGYW